MRNEALEKAGHSHFFIDQFSEFLNASEMTMQNLCTLINNLFSFELSTYNDNRNNYILHDILEITCYYRSSMCIQQSIKYCLECVNFLNNELSETKNKKKKFDQPVFTITPVDKELNKNDCVFDILNHVLDSYYNEKYKGLYEDDNDNNSVVENINDINLSYETQMNYVRLLASLLSQALYALRLLHESYEFPS